MGPIRVKPVEQKDHDNIRVVHDDDEPRMKSVEDVLRVLSQLSFAPSCVDMAWEWEVEEIFTNTKDGSRTHSDRDGRMQSVDPAGYRIRTTFQRPDRDDKDEKLAKGFGRWWDVPLDVTESGVVKTAYAAAEMILKHELMESFKWRGTRVFDPHHTIRELASIQPGRYVDSIPD